MGRLEGTVEGAVGDPIAGAVVLIKALGLVAESGAEGFFALHPIALSAEARSLTVRVEREG